MIQDVQHTSDITLFTLVAITATAATAVSAAVATAAAAITAAAVAAATVATAAAAVAATAVATAAAAVATTAATIVTWWTAFARLSLFHYDCPPVKVGFVECVDCALCLVIVRHFDKCETLGPVCKFICDNGAGRYFTELLKCGAQVVFPGVKI